VKIDLPCLHQEQDFSCVPACIRILLHYIGTDYPEAKISAVCKTTELGTDQDEAAQGVTLLGFKAVMLENAAFDDLVRFVLKFQPVIAFVSVKHLPYGGQSGVHAVVVNGVEMNRVSFIDPARGEEITVEKDTFLKAWQARSCLGLVIEPQNS
jgi:ABC-type bacteriocin/lantibiotic exporter with double-glycine peptidase domain